MYKVTKAFIYRARLYPVGQEVTERQYERMIRDKIAIQRGIPEKVAPQSPPVASGKKVAPDKKAEPKTKPEGKAAASPKKRTAGSKASDKKAAGNTDKARKSPKK